MFGSSDVNQIEILSSFAAEPSPLRWLAPPAMIDPSLKEIYIFQSAGKDLNPRHPGQLWVYQYERHKWTAADRANSGPGHGGGPSTSEPPFRMNQQRVYDPFTRTFWQFGGMSFDTGGRKVDELWCMSLVRPTHDDILRKARFNVRRQQFREMCGKTDSVRALNFLRTEVAAVVDHNDSNEASSFRYLMSHLLSLPQSPLISKRKPVPLPDGEPEEDMEFQVDGNIESLVRSASDQSPTMIASGLPDFAWTHSTTQASGSCDNVRALPKEQFQERTSVFETILEFINDAAKEPSTNLIDLVEGAGRT